MTRPDVFGPAQATLSLLTTREGRASRIGHYLTLLVGDWEAHVSPAAGGSVEVRLTARLASLEVVRGEGGLKPLSAGDKASIRTNALKTLDARNHPEVEVSLGPFHAPEGGTTVGVEGVATIAGVSAPVTIVLSDQGASAVLSQSDFGLTPYATMLGALRVGDNVAVRLELNSTA